MIATAPSRKEVGPHAAHGARRTAHVAVQARAGARRSLRVLLVDDEPMIGALFRDFLLTDEHTVELAENGAAALQKFRARAFDLVITDQTMTQMSGLELATEVKKLRPQIPVLLVTGAPDLVASVAIDFILAKPISRDAFREAISQFASN